jgi:hypothetical protein
VTIRDREIRITAVRIMNDGGTQLVNDHFPYLTLAQIFIQDEFLAGRDVSDRLIKIACQHARARTAAPGKHLTVGEIEMKVRKKKGRWQLPASIVLMLIPAS